MINSMTGFGSCKSTEGPTNISVEIKSVNNRFLDCSVKMPRAYSFAEETVKSIVQAALARGKTDVFISVDDLGKSEAVVRVNENVLKAYMDAVSRMETEYGIVNDMGAAAYSRLPEVMSVEKAETDAEAFTEQLSAAVKEALNRLCAMRAAEGERLAADISAKLDAIERLSRAVEQRSPETVREYREKLTARMEEILQGVNIDQSRILAEAAIFADKTAVDEEIVRLGSHIKQIRKLLTDGGSIGRKLDFLVQELNREANTIGSKCSDLEIGGMVIELKSEIEKIREQAQNLE
ncbi:MAG: YicC family protein [Oscillospiraceae bacterium]|nr:YicC family protein [Oscillospiraceae bacterium]